MNTELIKKKILDLAIRGKLVDQRPEEGTAEELYAQIQEEKRKLIAEVKIKKEKPLPEISEDEIPFDIPASWKWVRLNDGMIINPSVIADDEQETSFIPMADVESGYSSIINLKEKRIWKTVKKNFSRFENGYVLIAKITPCFQNRKSAIAENLVNGVGAGTTEFNVIRTNNNLLLNKFVLYFAKSEYFINYGQEHFTGTVGQQRFSGNAFYEMLFPLPPLSEQKRIVAKIEEIFSRIDVIEKAKADLAKDGNLLEKKILDLAIRGKLVEQRPEEGSAEELYAQIQEEKKKLIAEGKIKKEKPLPEIKDEEIPFDIPKSWKWVKLGNISESNIGLTYSPSDISEIGIPVMRSCNIQNNRLDFNNDLVRVNIKNIPEKNLLKENDILICARNGSRALVGKNAIIPKLSEPCAFGAFMAMVRTPFSKYVKIFLDSGSFRSVLDSVNTTTINQITQKNLLNIVIPLPPLSEQKRIVAKIEELLPYCYKLKE